MLASVYNLCKCLFVVSLLGMPVGMCMCLHVHLVCVCLFIYFFNVCHVFGAWWVCVSISVVLIVIKALNILQGKLLTTAHAYQMKTGVHKHLSQNSCFAHVSNS